MERLEIVESASGRNTAIAAGASEILIREPTKKSVYWWNSLEVYNMDANTNIEIQLDAQTSGSKIFVIPVGGIMVINPEEGHQFRTVTQKNLDASDAETASSILIKALHKRSRRMV